MSEEKSEFEKFKKFHLNHPDVRKKILDEFKTMPKTIFETIDLHAKNTPKQLAIIEYDTGEKVSYKQFSSASKAFASRLMEYGLKKGDIVATSLPFLKEHMFLWVGAMRLGCIMAPLDLRLKAIEINRLFEKIKPKIYFFLGKTPVVDFRPIIKDVMVKHHVKNGGSVKTWVQFQKESEGILENAMFIKDFAKNIKLSFVWNLIKEMFYGGVWKCQQAITKRDPCCIIFTTGSTGVPKAALLCHEGILAQTLSLKYAFMEPARGIHKIPPEEMTFLVNLPPSHVGGLTEQFCINMYSGTTAVVLSIFKPDKSLDAVQKYKCKVIGQIPALFNMQWNLPNYSDYNIDSLVLAAYGGQAVSREFLVKLKVMGKSIASGFGLTEASGFCSYTGYGAGVESVGNSLGWDSPVCKISIRKPMNEDGTQGDEMPVGEVGDVCFEGYCGDEKRTKECVSKEGILYTGDMGSYDKDGLHFVSRRKFIIKPKGYQVFPHEVEGFISDKFPKQIEKCAIVGVDHEIYSEGIVCVIELCKEGKITQEEVIGVCKDIASYKRPALVVVLPESEKMPLNRVGKIDYLKCKEVAQKAVEEERKKGGWDKK